MVEQNKSWWGNSTNVITSYAKALFPIDLDMENQFDFREMYG